MQSVKVVVVGDGAVGKTTFLFSFALECMPTEYVPTTFDNYSAVYNLEGRDVSLGLWDTAGQEDFRRLRPISYHATDVYLLFFSVVNPTSYENISEQWIQEVKQHSPGVPYFLIGTQCDQRENKEILGALRDRKEKPIGTKEGKKLAKDIGAVSYIEISAKDTSTYGRIKKVLCRDVSPHRYHPPKAINPSLLPLLLENLSPLSFDFDDGDLWEEVLRYTINEYKSQKKLGKHCWSIQCPQKITTMGRVACQGKCKLYYCEDCMEYWSDGLKLCPQCIMYEKKDREAKGKKIPDVKKRRIPPSERAALELEKEAKRIEKMKKKYEKELAKQGKTLEDAIREYEEKEAAKEKEVAKDGGEKEEKEEEEVKDEETSDEVEKKPAKKSEKKTSSKKK